MGHKPVELLEYSSDKFINRQEKVEHVMKKVRALTQGSSVDGKRTIIFTGERGTGKSWLLAHLGAKLRALSDVVVFGLDLSEYADWDPVLAVADILKRLNAETGELGKGLGTTLADMSRNLMQKIQPLLSKGVLVLLVDHVYESDWKLLAALEEYLLGPLAVEPRVLIVMTGRGRPYPWKRPELRLKAEFIALKPFPDVDTTAEQLERQQKQALDRAAKIHDLSGGNPLANFLLGAQDDPAVALDQVVKGMLDTVPDEHRGRVREHLEALSVLRAFDEERIPAMLAAYYDDEQRLEWSYAQSRGVREELVKWAFAHWDADQGGYVLDELTRKLLERYLETAQPGRWKKLQQAASKLYREWARDYPRTHDRWQREAQYHAQRL
ncbi:MAG: ATP-binding protein [Chloroflexota bacterium]|nr:ATP-binding protein [Chloroflexota bacterium]